MNVESNERIVKVGYFPLLVFCVRGGWWLYYKTDQLLLLCFLRTSYHLSQSLTD